MQTEGVDIRSVGNTQVGDQCEDNSLHSLVCLYLHPDSASIRDIGLVPPFPGAPRDSPGGDFQPESSH